jgi:hypothetical protein
MSKEPNPHVRQHRREADLLRADPTAPDPRTLRLIGRALVVISEPLVGMALMKRRREALNGEHDDHPAMEQARAYHDRILALRISDMPPPPELVMILVEIASQRFGGAPREQVWQRIGVHPDRGRELLLSRKKAQPDWPTWFTLRHAALNG